MDYYQDDICIQEKAGRWTGEKYEERQYESRDSKHKGEKNGTPRFDVWVHIENER